MLRFLHIDRWRTVKVDIDQTTFLAFFFRSIIDRWETEKSDKDEKEYFVVAFLSDLLTDGETRKIIVVLR